MSLCLICLINCSKHSFSVDNENDNVDDDDIQLSKAPVMLILCNRLIDIIECVQHYIFFYSTEWWHC